MLCTLLPEGWCHVENPLRQQTRLPEGASKQIEAGGNQRAQSKGEPSKGWNMSTIRWKYRVESQSRNRGLLLGENKLQMPRIPSCKRVKGGVEDRPIKKVKENHRGSTLPHAVGNSWRLTRALRKEIPPALGLGIPM